MLRQRTDPQTVYRKPARMPSALPLCQCQMHDSKCHLPFLSNLFATSRHASEPCSLLCWHIWLLAAANQVHNEVSLPSRLSALYPAKSVPFLRTLHCSSFQDMPISQHTLPSSPSTIGQRLYCRDALCVKDTLACSQVTISCYQPPRFWPARPCQLLRVPFNMTGYGITKWFVPVLCASLQRTEVQRSINGGGKASHNDVNEVDEALKLKPSR